MRKYHVAFFFSALIFCSLDYLWLDRVASSFYQEQLGRWLANPDIVVVALYYLIHVLGITVFCVRPAVHANSAAKALVLGMLLGLVAYGAFDLGNLAAIKGWPLQLSVIDLLWGVLVTGVAAEAGFFAMRWFVPSPPEADERTGQSPYPHYPKSRRTSPLLH
jgi:uncharacterized membrane protein